MKVAAVLVPALPSSASTTSDAGAAAVIAIARATPGALVRVATTDDASASGARLGVAPAHVIALRGDDPGEWRRTIFQDLFRRGARQVVLLDADAAIPDDDALADAFAALTSDAGRVAIGPAEDGGCYLIGLAGPKVPDLFTGVRWGTRYVLMDILRRCEFEARRVEYLALRPAGSQACSAS